MDFCGPSRNESLNAAERICSGTLLPDMLGLVVDFLALLASESTLASFHAAPDSGTVGLSIVPFQVLLRRVNLAAANFIAWPFCFGRRHRVGLVESRRKE